LENNIDFIERPINEENPRESEIRDWIKKSGYPIKRFFNTSGTLYKDLNLKEKLETMSEDEQIKLLASDGMLVKRPIFFYPFDSYTKSCKYCSYIYFNIIC
jgi:arsenate reductase